jgi:hypothetical protein
MVQARSYGYVAPYDTSGYGIPLTELAVKNEISMSIIQSNTDALLVAIPMVGLLFIGVFRLDELFGKPKKQPVESRRQLSGWDKNGQPICADPDGKMPTSRGCVK